MTYQNDISLLQGILAKLPTAWDGKMAILEMKERDAQWRQMEWIGWYFEMLCKDKMSIEFDIPGEKYGNVEFDSKRSINWDMKTSAIKTHHHIAILNDMHAVDASISAHGAHGIVMGLADVEYNDEERSFQQWHSSLKGGLSTYEQKRIQRNAVSRYRKTSALLRQILFLVLTDGNKKHLQMHAQGRNSDGSPRQPKYAVNLEKADKFEVGRINFADYARNN